MVYCLIKLLAKFALAIRFCAQYFCCVVRSISFVTLGLVLPLFHFQFLLLGFPSIARGTCLFHLLLSSSSSSSSSLSSPLRTVFTIIYLKQTVSLRYTVLQLFCIYSLCYMLCYFARGICSVLLY